MFTLSGSLVGPRWAGRPGTATPHQGCGTELAAGTADGRPCCTRHRGSACHHHLHHKQILVNSEPQKTNLFLFFCPWKGKRFKIWRMLLTILLCPHLYGFTCCFSEGLTLNVGLPDKPSLFCSELADSAASLSGCGPSLHQPQQRWFLPECWTRNKERTRSSSDIKQSRWGENFFGQDSFWSDVWSKLQKMRGATNLTFLATNFAARVLGRHVPLDASVQHSQQHMHARKRLSLLDSRFPLLHRGGYLIRR